MKRLFPVFSLLLLWLAPAFSQSAQADSTATNGGQASSMKPAAAAPAPTAPQTELIPDSAAPSIDPILDPGPLPNKQLSLIGGTVTRLDAIRNRIVVQPFGGGKSLPIWFDERSHIYRNGAAVTMLGIHRGDRVYADTMELNRKVFARAIRVETSSGPAEAGGQILRFDRGTGLVVMRDTLTSQVVHFSVTAGTHLHQRNDPAAAGDLLPGTLLEVVFAPGHKGGSAQDVNVLAIPGKSYQFAGQITNINLRSGRLDVDNQSDGKNYEIGFTSAQVNREQLRVGASITTTAEFSGHGYTATSISVTQPVADNAGK